MNGSSSSNERRWFRRAIGGCVVMALGAIAAIGGQWWGLNAIHKQLLALPLPSGQASQAIDRVAAICGFLIWGGLVLSASGVLWFCVTLGCWLRAITKRRAQ